MLHHSRKKPSEFLAAFMRKSQLGNWTCSPCSSLSPSVNSSLWPSASHFASFTYDKYIIGGDCRFECCIPPVEGKEFLTGNAVSGTGYPNGTWHFLSHWSYEGFNATQPPRCPKAEWLCRACANRHETPLENSSRAGGVSVFYKSAGLYPPGDAPFWKGNSPVHVSSGPAPAPGPLAPLPRW